MVRLPGRKVLLGLKKRGIGEGFYNGFGGKCEVGETIRQGAHREVRLCCGRHTVQHTHAMQLKEEAGITATDLDWRGVLLFKMGANPQPWEVHGAHAEMVNTYWSLGTNGHHSVYHQCV